MRIQARLNSIVELWQRLIKRAKEDKKEKFGNMASRIWDFVGKNYDELYITCDEKFKPFPNGGHPHFRARLNKTAQFIDTYLPYVHYQAPHRKVEPSRPRPPMELFGLMGGQQIPPGMPMPQSPIEMADRIRAWQQQWFLNYLKGETGLDGETVRGTIEGLGKGRGVVWHELTEGTYGEVPGTFYDSVDYMFSDPDARMLRNAGYIIRERSESRWRLAELFELDPEEIKAQYKTSLTEIASKDKECDIVWYYEIYSRIGFGLQLKSDSEEKVELPGDLRNVWLVIIPGMEYPANLPPHIFTENLTESEFRNRVDWPIPYYADRLSESPWPCTELDFLPGTECCWPRPPLQAALPLQVFLDQAYSFMMDRISWTSRLLLLVSDSLQEAVKKALLSGLDGSVVPVTGKPAAMKELIELITFPDASADNYKLISLISSAFEEMTAMSPLLLGNMGDTQMRSGTEARVRDTRAMSRPEQFRQKTREWHSRIARKEGIAARLYVTPRVIAPLAGEPVPEMDEAGVPVGQLGPFSQLWSALVNTDDPYQACAELDYTIEVGSDTPKNKQWEMENFQQVGQIIGPVGLQCWTATGNAKPHNAFIRWMGEVFETRLDDMMLPDMTPPLPAGAPTGQPAEAPPPQ